MLNLNATNSIRKSYGGQTHSAHCISICALLASFLLSSGFTARADDGQLGPARQSIFVQIREGKNVPGFSKAVSADQMEIEQAIKDAITYSKQKNYDRSANVLKTAIEKFEATLGPLSPSISKLRLELGSVQFLQRDFLESIHQLRLAVNGFDYHQSYNADCLLAYQLLAESYRELLNLPEAARFARKALCLAADKSISNPTVRLECLRLEMQIVLDHLLPELVLQACEDHLRLLPLLDDSGKGADNQRLQYEAFLHSNICYSLSALNRRDELSRELKVAQKLVRMTNDGEELSHKLASLTDQCKSNYIDNCISEHGMIWSADRLPMKVCVDSSGIADELAGSVSRALENALATWNKATDYKLKYVWEKNPKKADLVLTFRKKYSTDGLLGKTFSLPIISDRYVSEILSSKIEIDILRQETTVPSQLTKYGLPFPAYFEKDPFDHARRRMISPRAEQELRLVILHEMGHALGLRHSAVPGDLMYNTFFCVKDLSARDISTARLWYEKDGESKVVERSRHDIDLASFRNSQRLLASHPQDFFCLMEAGRSAALIKRNELARRYFQSCEKLNPRSAAPKFQLAILEMNQKNYSAAIADLKRSYALDQKYATSDVYANLAISEFQRRNYAAASSYCEKALSKQPSFYRLRKMYAAALAEQGKYSAAINQIKTFIEIFPSSDQGYLVQGEILRDMKDYAGSLKSLEKSLMLNPENRKAKLERDSVSSRLSSITKNHQRPISSERVKNRADALRSSLSGSP